MEGAKLLPAVLRVRPAEIRYTRVMNGSQSEGLFGRDEEKESAGDWITAYCDGGSRGNPGSSGFGVYIQDERGKPIAELSEYLGKRTNNYAEYSGLLAALNFAVEQGHRRLRVVSDSELMVKQIKGQYRVNSPELKPLYEEAKRCIAQLGQFRIEHVLRGKNRQADRLANEAMDRGMGRAAAKPAAADKSTPARNGSQAIQFTPLQGFVKNGVVHLVEGSLPEGIFVRIVPGGQ